MWNQITLDVPEDLRDALVGELFEDGVSGVWEATAAQAGLIRLTFYFGDQSNLDSIEGRIREMFKRCALEPPVILRGVVEDRDWSEEWKKSYSSFPIGRSFFLIPSWMDSSLSRRPSADTNRSGSGVWHGYSRDDATHDRSVGALGGTSAQVVLDVGTGSGILAMASRMLGAKEVIACDIDPVAVHVALANIVRNHEPEVWTFCGSVDALANDSIDLLLGNLTAEVIIELFPEFQRILRPEVMAIFSGILNEQYEDVLEVCGQFGFTIHEKIVRGEWVALVAEKHGA